MAASRKFFCKEECKAEDVLVKTDDDVAQRDRYSIKYRNGPSGGGILSVTITRMTKSDSGRYRCGVGRNSLPDSYTDFEIRVSDGEFLMKLVYLLHLINISDVCSIRMNEINLNCGNTL